MSSLAAARADNFYYPPEWDPNSGTNQPPNTKGLKNAKNGSLGARANKSSEGILVIRFEMPFNVWCDGCNHLIAKGVRFNAEKKQAGSYFSTKIWSFRMTSPCCSTAIEVRTDPKACDYVVVSGARKKVEDYEAEDAGTQELMSAEERHAIASNPFARLESGQVDKARAMGERERLAALRFDNEDKYGQDYAANKALRRRLRAVRKDAKALDAHRQALGVDKSVKLLPHSEEDRLLASATQFDSDGKFKRSLEHQRRVVQTQSIFARAEPGKSYSKQRPRLPPAAAAAASGGSAARGSSSRQQQQQQQAAKRKPSNQDRLQLLAKRKRMEATPRLGGL